jgi:hypothetical protein
VCGSNRHVWDGPEITSFSELFNYYRSKSCERF